MSPTSTTPNGTVTVSFNVTNTGNVAGATVGQLYVTPPSDPALETPREQLAGFKRTNVLNPGQTQHITLSVKMSSLSRWDERLLKQVVIDGPYEFKVGADSAHLQASPRVTVAGTLSPHVQYVTVQPDQVIFRPGQTLELTGKNPWIKPDTDPSLEQRHAPADNIVEAVDNNQSFVNLAHAKVSYSTTNPRVATVSPSGKLRAVSVGVTAVNVTVDGVTGSTPIVVKQPLKVMSGDARRDEARPRRRKERRARIAVTVAVAVRGPEGARSRRDRRVQATGGEPRPRMIRRRGSWGRGRPSRPLPRCATRAVPRR